MSGGGRGLIIVNRVTVPGPRQVLLHVKIAEINRSATRDIGVSWLYSRGKSIIGSAAGNNATFSTTANGSISQSLGPRGFAGPIEGTVGGSSLAVPAGTSPLFGVFDAGHFSLFIDALRSKQPGQGPRRAEPDGDGRAAGPHFLVGGIDVRRSAKTSSIRRRQRPCVTVQFQRFGTILTFLPRSSPTT